MAFILLLNAAGALGLFQLYKVGFEYDKFLHFIIPAISVITITYFNCHWYGIKLSKAIILSVIIVVLIGFLWELFEVFGDWTFKTKMLGQYGKFVTKDTVWDLIINILGITSGAIISIIRIKN